VNTYTTGRQQSPAVAADPAGGFVVVWQSGSYYGTEGQDGSNIGVFGQRLDAAASPVGGEFQVNTYTTGRQSTPAVAVQPTGGFVVVVPVAAGEQLTERQALQALLGVHGRVLGHHRQQVHAVEAEPDDVERPVAGRGNLERQSHAAS